MIHDLVLTRVSSKAYLYVDFTKGSTLFKIFSVENKLYSKDFFNKEFGYKIFSKKKYM